MNKELNKEAVLMGQRIKDRRLHLRKQKGEGFTQDDVANLLSRARGEVISREGYAHYENGRNMIAITDLPHLAKVLDCSILYFFGEMPSSVTEDDDAITYYRKMPSILKPAAQAVMKALYDTGKSG